MRQALERHSFVLLAKENSQAENQLRSTDGTNSSTNPNSSTINPDGSFIWDIGRFLRIFCLMEIVVDLTVQSTTACTTNEDYTLSVYTSVCIYIHTQPKFAIIYNMIEGLIFSLCHQL